MTTRRSVISLLARACLCAVSWIGLGLHRIPRALAETGKRILDKDTDPATLIYEDPKNLDTSNLPVMPLDEFGTMGDIEIDIPAEDWSLRITGAVESEQRISYQELTSLPSIEREVLLVCPGVFVNHGRWKGVPLSELVRRAGPTVRDGHIIVRGRSRSGDQSQRFDLSDMDSGGLLLAYSVNGRTLPRRHGYPVRLVAENHMGYQWTKYVFEIEVARGNV